MATTLARQLEHTGRFSLRPVYSLFRVNMKAGRYELLLRSHSAQEVADLYTNTVRSINFSSETLELRCDGVRC